MEVNWDEAERKPGIYLATVGNCQESHAKTSGNPMFTVFFVDECGQDLCIDHIVTKGGGWRWPGKSKLKRLLGLDDINGLSRVEAEDLVGKKVYVALHEETSEDYAPRMAVNARAEGTPCGYYPLDAELPEPVQVVIPPENPEATQISTPF